MDQHKTQEASPRPQGVEIYAWLRVAPAAFLQAVGPHYELFGCMSWALRLVWSISPRLPMGQVTQSLLLGFLPAGSALAAKGLVDAAVESGRVADPGWSLMLPWLGEAVESGTHQQLLDEKGVYARLFDLHERQRMPRDERD